MFVQPDWTEHYNILQMLCQIYIAVYIPFFCWKVITTYRAISSGRVCTTCWYRGKDGKSCCLSNPCKAQPKVEHCSAWEGKV